MKKKKYIFSPSPWPFFICELQKEKKEAICNSLWIELLLYYPPDTLRFINQRHCFSLKTPSTLRAFGAKNLTYGGKRRLRHENSQELCGDSYSWAGDQERALVCANAKRRKLLRLMTLFWSHFSFDGELVRRKRLVFILFSTANLDAR
jgi:hypothetical protein